MRDERQQQQQQHRARGQGTKVAFWAANKNKVLPTLGQLLAKVPLHCAVSSRQFKGEAPQTVCGRPASALGCAKSVHKSGAQLCAVSPHKQPDATNCVRPQVCLSQCTNWALLGAVHLHELRAFDSARPRSHAQKRERETVSTDCVRHCGPSQPCVNKYAQRLGRIVSERACFLSGGPRCVRRPLYSAQWPPSTVCGQSAARGARLLANGGHSSAPGSCGPTLRAALLRREDNTAEQCKLRPICPPQSPSSCKLPVLSIRDQLRRQPSGRGRMRQQMGRSEQRRKEDTCHVSSSSFSSSSAASSQDALHHHCAQVSSFRLLSVAAWA